MSGEDVDRRTQGAAFILFDVRAVDPVVLPELVQAAEHQGAVGVRVRQAVGEVVFQGAQAIEGYRPEELLDELELTTSLGLPNTRQGRTEAGSIWSGLTRSETDARALIRGLTQEGTAAEHADLIADVGRVAELFVGTRLNLRMLASVLGTVCEQSYSRAVRSIYFTNISERRLRRLVDLVNRRLALDPPLVFPKKPAREGQ